MFNYTYSIQTSSTDNIGDNSIIDRFPFHFREESELSGNTIK